MKPLLVSKEHHNQYAIGIDIGGTKILTALVDRSGSIIHQVEFPTMPETGSDDVIRRIHEAVRILIDRIPELGRLLGIGVISAGVIDSEKMSIVYSANLGWEDVEIGAILEKSFQVPVMLGNDANLAALAEYVWGTNKEIKDLIYITISTGIGAGIVSGGQLVKGVSDSAGEFGHISVDSMGPKCGCGNYGCLENYCSGTAIANIANTKLPLRSSGVWTSKDVFDAAKDGNNDAIEIIRLAGFHLGNAIITLIHLFNPSQIIMGGGVMSGESMLLQEAQKIIDERCLPDMRKQLIIRRTKLGKQIGVLGAAGLFFMNDAIS